MDGVDAKRDRLLRRREGDGPPSPQNLSARPRDRAGQQLYQRRLAGAVLADDGVDLALNEFEIDRLRR